MSKWVDGAKPPSVMSMNLTCFGWWPDVKWASSTSISSKDVWLTMGVFVIMVLCDTAVPLMVLTVLRTKLNTSSCIASNQDSEHDGTALGSLGGLWGLINLCMASCCCSTRTNRWQISLLWAFTSSTCWRCILDKTDTCSLCVISSSNTSDDCWSCSCNWAAWLFGLAHWAGSSSLLIAWAIWACMA